MKMMHALVVAFVCVSLHSGCGSTTPVVQSLDEVTGKVLLPQGVALKGGKLVLRPAGGLRRPVAADIQQDGTFVLDSSAEKAPVLPGTYDVYLVFDDTPQGRKLQRSVPAKYRKLTDEDSDVSVTLDETPQEVLVRLKRG